MINDSVTYSKILLMLKTSDIGRTKLEFDNAKITITNNNLIITTDESYNNIVDGKKHLISESVSKVFSMNEIESYKKIKDTII